MQPALTKKLATFGSLAVIYVIACMIQTHILINWDVSWLSYLATQLVDHGINKENFFEINTPMSIYIYIPAVLIHKIFAISIVTAVRASIFILASISLGLCYPLIHKLYSNKITTTILPIVVAFIFLILPINQFGEREHFFLILIMPYLFLTALDAEHKTLSVIIGIFAAIGFSIKPHFIIPFILIETYLMIQKKSFSAWLRIDTLIIIIFLFGYLLSIFLLQPDYYHHVLPLALKYYYSGSKTPFIFFYSDRLFLFCISAAIIYFFQRKNPYRTLGMILLLALVGLLMSYLLQSTASYYRLYPALGISLLLLSLLACSFPSTESLPSFAQTIAVLLVIFAVPIYSIYCVVSHSFSVKKYGLVNNMINYINSQNTVGSCYFISTSPPFPAVDYVKKQNICSTVSYSQPYWILSGILTQSKKLTSAAVENDKIAFIQSIVAAFHKDKPDFVFVDKNILIHFMYRPFDYIKYFSYYAPFRSAWKNYSYIDHVENFDVYKKGT